MHEDLAVALAAGDRRRCHADDAEPARREVVRYGDHGGRARLHVTHHATFADGLAPGLELRLDERDDVAAIAQLCERWRKRETQRDERDVGDHEIHGLFDGHTLARVHALVDDDARVLAQAPIELALPDVDGVHARGSALQQHIGEATGRRADVDGDLSGHVEAERVEGTGQLVTTARDVLGTGVDGELGVFRDRRRRPVGATSVNTHRARQDECLSALAAWRESALHQELIEPHAFGHRADSRAHSRYCAAMPVSYARMAGISSLLGGVLVLLGIGIAGAITPNYDATRDVISASQLGPYGFLVTLALAAGGTLTVVFASLLQRTLPPGNPIGPALLVLRGWGALFAAAFLADVGPVRTTGGVLHVIGFVGGAIAFGIGLFFIAGRMRHDEEWRALAPYTVATALGSLAVLGLFVGLGPRYVGDTGAQLSAVGGAIERLSTVTTWSWHLVVGAWLLLRPAVSAVES